MMDKRLAWVVLIGLSLFAAGCGGNLVLTRIDPVEVPIDVSYPDTAAPTLQLDVPVGELAVEAGGTSLVSGTITYNIEQWEPLTSEEGGTARVYQAEGIEGVPPSDSRNEWDLELGTAAPYELRVAMGAVEADLDLSGLPLTSLTVNSGAGDTRARFEEANPEALDRLEVNAGAGNVTLAGLLDANFARLVVRGGVGEIELRFDGGSLAADASAEITGGAGNVTIVVDTDAPVRIEASTGLGGITVTGDLERSGDGYETPGYQTAEARLDIAVTVGAGRVNLEAR